MIFNRKHVRWADLTCLNCQCMYLIYAFVVLALGSVATSCSAVATQEADNTELSSRSEEVVFSTFGLSIPDNSISSIVGNEWLISLPAGYGFAALLNNGQEFLARTSSSGAGDGPNVSITCTCNSDSGGCSPFSQGDDKGCYMSSCKTCTQSLTSVPGGIDAMTIFQEDAPLIVDGFEDLAGLQFLPFRLLDHSFIKSYIEELSDFVWDNFEVDAPTKDIVVNVMGNLVIMTVPADSDDQSLVVSAGPGGGESGFSCTCNTEGSCKERKKLNVKICDASTCKSCTMNLSLTDPGTESQMILSVDVFGRWSEIR